MVAVEGAGGVHEEKKLHATGMYLSAIKNSMKFSPTRKADQVLTPTLSRMLNRRTIDKSNKRVQSHPRSKTLAFSAKIMAVAGP